jgi:hypothetical protein
MDVLSSPGGYRPIVRGASPDSEKFFIMVVGIAFALVMGVGGFCGYFVVQDRLTPDYSCTVRVDLKGPVTIDEAFDALTKADFGPVDKEGVSPTVTLTFSPWCGQPGSSMQKNSAKEVRRAYITIAEDPKDPNGTRGDLRVSGKKVNEVEEEAHDERMECIGERLEEVFTKEMNFTTSSGRFRPRCADTVPGFGPMVVVGAAVTVVLIRWRNRK